MFFSFDGVDGAGKSTQIALLGDWLRGKGYDVVECRDPGSTPLGESPPRHPAGAPRHADRPPKRNAALHGGPGRRWWRMSSAPRFAAGKAVISDRFLLANVVYQAYAGGLSVDEVWQVGAVAVDGVMPKLTFLSGPQSAAAAQRMNRELDRMEAQGREFQERVRAGFLAEAARRSDIVVIDAFREPAVVHAEVVAAAAFVVPPLGGSATA